MSSHAKVVNFTIIRKIFEKKVKEIWEFRIFIIILRCITTLTHHYGKTKLLLLKDKDYDYT